MARARGFTLLELLVAVALLALIAAMAYGGLGSVMTSRGAVEAHLEALGALQTAMGMLERDLAMAAPRAVRDGLGGWEPALVSRPLRQRRLSLTRGGRPPPPALRRSALERVDYGIEGGILVRSSWRQLDRTPGDTPLRVELLEGVEGLALRFLDDQGQWQADWPPGDEERARGTRLPAAVELRLDHARWGGLRLVVAVAP